MGAVEWAVVAVDIYPHPPPPIWKWGWGLRQVSKPGAVENVDGLLAQMMVRRSTFPLPLLLERPLTHLRLHTIHPPPTPLIPWTTAASFSPSAAPPPLCRAGQPRPRHQAVRRPERPPRAPPPLHPSQPA
eukprot:SAG11_NODE_2090_length_3843_cov_4.605502_1_plen_129_part_10